MPRILPPQPKGLAFALAQPAPRSMTQPLEVDIKRSAPVPSPKAPRDWLRQSGRRRATLARSRRSSCRRSLKAAVRTRSRRGTTRCGRSRACRPCAAPLQSLQR